MIGDNFKARLLILLKTKGMTVVELADKIGVSRTAIDVWKEDKRMPSYSNLVKISEILETSCDYLMKGSEVGLLKDEMMLLSVYRAMDPSTKELALELLNIIAKRLGGKKANNFLQGLSN